jgi:drug/metabolite transporter (DMT)-like permease
MPLAGAVAINSSAPLIATVASVVFLKETGGPVGAIASERWISGRIDDRLPGLRHVPGWIAVRGRQRDPVRHRTVGARSMTATESAETSTMYQMVFLTAFFTAALPFGWVTPTIRGWGAMVVNGLGNALGQYLSTRALHLTPTSAVVPLNYFSLVWAIILGFLVWGDMPSAVLLVDSAISAKRLVGWVC